MLAKLLLCSIFYRLATSTTSTTDFVFNGFRDANLSIDGQAAITHDGVLILTNSTKHDSGHGFYPAVLRLKRSPTGDSFSFSTNFVYALVPYIAGKGGKGFAFVISPTTDFSHAFSNQFLGLFNTTNDGQPYNRIMAIEFDTVYNPEFQDIDDNHVGIDINGLVSVQAHTAGYFRDSDGEFEKLTLISGESMQAWVDFDGDAATLNVTISPLKTSKPMRPLLSVHTNLSDIMVEEMHVGFSSATGVVDSYHCVLGWSFAIAKEAQPLDIGKLPDPPKSQIDPKGSTSAHVIWVPSVVALLILAIAGGIAWRLVRNKKFEEIVEDWELEFGPQRIPYKDLFKATKGFKDDSLLGVGGFGRVYKGVLPGTKTEVAVKQVPHNSRDGVRVFMAEVASLGRLRHRNLVQLLGYCRRKGELLLVYDFMHNGSLDKYLFGGKGVLEWRRRLQIIKSVASGLVYLHEDCQQVVIHRDVKAGNVLLDDELNGRLGDFGLARLYEHGTDPRTTRVVGTMGYIAPELARTGKATTATDVFAFGALLLEVASGRRPIEIYRPEEEVELVECVLNSWRRGAIVVTADTKLEEKYVMEEMETVLKLGLLCSHPAAAARPSMRQVVQFLDGDAPIPEMFLSHWSSEDSVFSSGGRSGDFVQSNSGSVASMLSLSSEGR